jgi:hypothetical protein
MSRTAFEGRDSMSFPELLAWAWRETPPVHKNVTNLVIHIFAVPLFVLGHLFLLAAAILIWWLAIVGLLCIIVSIALQGLGHSMERQQVPPFTGPRDFVRRLYAEQFCNFWRFLFSGQWWRQISR